MFRNRPSSQKPTAELYENFRQSFPHLRTASDTDATSSQPHIAPSLSDALDSTLNSRHFSEDVNSLREHDSTPRASGDSWRGLTPSIMDPNSFAFAQFANLAPGIYTPTPGGTSTLYHNQAGDLHTPRFTLGLGTPLSGPSSDSHFQAGQAMPMMPGYQPTSMHPSHFENPDPFAAAQPSFAPSQLQNPTPTTLQHLDAPLDDSPLDDMGLDVTFPQDQSPMLAFDPQSLDDSLCPSAPPLHSENFRYHTTLNAPTAMVKHREEVPLTYLNKGQTYALTIVDQVPEQPGPGPTKYRTFVRVSFEDDQQRQRPGTCWQLWKEGRGTNEAHHRGGRLQAVEFVDHSVLGGPEDQTKPKIELESASFDGFCVTWTLAPNAPADCSIGVRFNFLSTDFSHSKGVKGIPVRLCSKTQLVESLSTPPPERTSPERCFCKVKLFRDHGAERKLSNDVAHIKKTIDKLKNQIAQAESGLKDLGKRKRAGSNPKTSGSNRPGKVPKHKRTWSMSSANSASGRPSAEEDLHLKLATLQDMFTSTRPVSVLFLRGEELDDPDLHPVRLPGEPSSLTKVETYDSGFWEKQSANATSSSSAVSPTPSVQSVHSGSLRAPGYQLPTPFPPSRVPSNELQIPQPAMGDVETTNPQHLASPPDQPTKVQTCSPSGTVTGWIEAVGVDYSYQLPPDRVVKPVACFYIQPRVLGKPPPDNLYRAVYLTQRRLKDFVGAVATKCDIEPTQVIRTVRINRNGLTILLDDDDIRELPEGQDMTAEFVGLRSQGPMKRVWDAGASDIQVDGDIGPETTTTSGYELKLLY